MTATTDKQAEPRPRFKLYTVEELEALPDPSWLIDGVVPQAALAELYGKPGAGKSFLALDWALSVAAGIGWLGHSLNQADAVYVSAEGGSGLKKRIAAWWAEHPGVDLGQVRFLKEPVNMLDPGDVKALIAAVRQTELDPTLVVIDTLARCFGAGDENSAKDMNAFVANADQIKATFPKATVLVVHHTGKKPKSGDRGSSALPGATDTLMVLSKNENVLTLKCKKQKDWDEFKDIKLSLKVVELSDGKSSCVIARRGVLDVLQEPEENKSIAEKNNVKAMDALQSFGSEGATYKKWLEASGLVPSTFKNVRNRLPAGSFHHEDKLYRIANADEGQGQGHAQPEPLPLAS